MSVDRSESSTVWRIASVAVLGSFLAQIDATMLATALPVLANQLKSGIATIQWVVTGYLLSMVLALPMAGVLVERIGSRQLYLSCYAGFAVSALLCAFAWSAGSLIVFRVVHGLIGGVMAPLAQMMIARAAGARIARVAGYAAIPILMGPVLGPIVAGLVLSHLTWQWLFVISAAVAGVGFCLAVLFLPHDWPKEGQPSRNVDWTGMVLLSPGLVLLLAALDRVASLEGGVMLAAATGLLGAFVFHLQRTGSAALLDPALLRQTGLRTAALTQFLSYGVNTGCQLLFPMFLSMGLGRSVTEVGLLMMPLGLGLLCAYPVMGRAVERFGAPLIAQVGNLVSLAAITLAIAVAGDVIGQALIVVALFLVGAGLGATGIAAVTAGYGSVPKSMLASAATVLNIAQRLGGPVLATLCTTLLSWLLQGQNMTLATPHVFTVVFAFIWVVVAVCAVVTRKMPVQLDQSINN